MSGEKPREIAAELLDARRRGVFVETLLEEALEARPLSPPDRGFLQELVYGVVRWELTLDWLIGQKTGGKAQKPLVQNLLRLALYQMFWLDRVPSYAAVNESVELCKRRGHLPQARFINAVLRGYGREADQTRTKLEGFRRTNLALGFSHPEWLARRWTERFGIGKAARLLDWNNTPPPVFARVNTLKTDAATLMAAWDKEGVRFEETRFDWIPSQTAFRLAGHPPLATLATFREGGFYVQDPSTLLAVELLGGAPGEAILDSCAAPGGKTTYLAQRLNNQARILALDADPERLKRVVENCARLGVDCVRTEGDAESVFDRVLVDAPCSNTGVMRRRVDLRWRIQPEEIARLAAAQRQLLQIAARRLRPGGTILYSTCSLEREENEAVVREFLAAHPHFKLEAERALTPFDDGTDGAYCARLAGAPA